MAARERSLPERGVGLPDLSSIRNPHIPWSLSKLWSFGKSYASSRHLTALQNQAQSPQRSAVPELRRWIADHLRIDQIKVRYLHEDVETVLPHIVREESCQARADEYKISWLRDMTRGMVAVAWSSSLAFFFRRRLGVEQEVWLPRRAISGLLASQTTNTPQHLADSICEWPTSLEIQGGLTSESHASPGMRVREAGDPLPTSRSWCEACHHVPNTLDKRRAKKCAIGLLESLKPKRKCSGRCLVLRKNQNSVRRSERCSHPRHREPRFALAMLNASEEWVACKGLCELSLEVLTHGSEVGIW